LNSGFTIHSQIEEEMKITDAFLGEHGVFYAQFSHLEQVVPQQRDLALIQAQGALLTAALETHAHLEDELLFSALEPHFGQGGPLAVMRLEHEQIEGGLARLPGLGDLGQARELLLQVVRVARDHFAKEEQVLYPMAHQALGEAKLAELGALWAAQREVVMAIAR
jgi:iron-sulfur cluster repair protein YtfE (RIC family)